MSVIIILDAVVVAIVIFASDECKDIAWMFLELFVSVALVACKAWIAFDPVMEEDTIHAETHGKAWFYGIAESTPLLRNYEYDTKDQPQRKVAVNHDAQVEVVVEPKDPAECRVAPAFIGPNRFIFFVSPPIFLIQVETFVKKFEEKNGVNDCSEDKYQVSEKLAETLAHARHATAYFPEGYQ